MNHPDLQQFAKQLAAWTELIIEHGRTPFRRVDLYPQLHTEQGLLQPPLIFWINRQSMMAGGVLLLPEQNLEAELQRGRSCAEALGLRHFITWEVDQIRIWQLSGDQIEAHQDFNLGQNNHPDAYRQLLGEVLEALKLLAVLGMVPQADLSPHYLHNLLLTTLDLSLPSLVKSYRSHRAIEGQNESDNADRDANEANRQLLLQLLALLWKRKLPDAILPDKLERAIELSLPKLPEQLRIPLSRIPTADALPIPHDSAVCFHHLLLRLRQLNWAQPPERALAALRLLIDNWYPETENIPQSTSLNIYPSCPQLSARNTTFLSDSPALLTATALLENLLEITPRMQHYGNLFQYGPNDLPNGLICGSLNKDRLPGRDERQQYSTLLRVSWPNRRFRLGNQTPMWLWETLHLLGLCAQQQKVLLTIPLAALQTPVDGPLWPLLLENYRFTQLKLLADNCVCLQLQREINPDPEQVLKVFSLDSERTINLSKSPAQSRSQLLLALLLSTELYQVLEEQLTWPDNESLSKKTKEGLTVYATSQLGSYLWQLLSNTPLPKTADDLEQQANWIAWPHPDHQVLTEMTKHPNSDIDSNRQLDDLLGKLDLTSLPLDETNDANQLPVAQPVVEKDLKKYLIQKFTDEGIPAFPEQYLYFLEKPQMIRYQLPSPLKITSEFLGQIELEDDAGQKIQVYGKELAQTLILCSELGRTEVELPKDLDQLALLLNHYRQDLQRLQKQLNSRCFSRLESAKSARKLANNIWKKLPVPTIKWLED